MECFYFVRQIVFAFVFRKFKYRFVTFELSKPNVTCFYFKHLFAYFPLDFSNACLGKMHISDSP